MDKADQIGAAVVGVGIYGANHARVFHNSPLVELMAVWSRTAQTAMNVGETYGVPYTTDLDAIVNDDRIRLVSIATPDFAHTEPAVQMLLAGKDVLLEKPMATSVADCEKILAAREKGGGKLMINFHNRWYPALAKAKQYIETDAIGEVNTAFLRLSDRIDVATEWLSWSAKSGPHWFLFPHIADLAMWLLNDNVCEVSAYASKGVLSGRGIDTYDTVQAQLRFPNAVVTLESSWILPLSWPTIIEFKSEIYGKSGCIHMISDNEGLAISSDRYRVPLLLDPITEDEPIRYFIDCVKNDIQPQPDGYAGLKVTAVIEAVDRSIKTGRKISV